MKKESAHIQSLESRTRATETCVKNSAARISRLESRVEEMHGMLRALVAPPGSMTLEPRFAYMDGIRPTDDGLLSPLGRSLGVETPQAGESIARFRFVSDASTAVLGRPAPIPEESPSPQPMGGPFQ